MKLIELLQEYRAREYFSNNPEKLKRLEIKPIRAQIADFSRKELATFKKEAFRNGIEEDTYLAVMSWVSRYQDGVRKSIPTKILNVLKQVTVKEQQIPKEVYRGLHIPFADPDIINKFSLGDFGKTKKLSSWSSSYNVAKSFSNSTKPPGLHVILKHIPTIESVVADFRYLPTNFFTEKELLIKSGAVYEIIQSELTPENYKYEIPNIYSKDEYIFNQYFDALSDKDLPLEIRNYKDMTLREVGNTFNKRLPTSISNDIAESPNLPFLLWTLNQNITEMVDKWCHAKPQIDGDRVYVECDIISGRLGRTRHPNPGQPNIDDIIKDTINNTKFEGKLISDFHATFNTEVTLLNTHRNNIVFNFEIISSGLIYKNDSISSPPITIPFYDQKTDILRKAIIRKPYPIVTLLVNGK